MLSIGDAALSASQRDTIRALFAPGAPEAASHSDWMRFAVVTGGISYSTSSMLPEAKGERRSGRE